MLEALKIVGSIVGLATGAFVLVDRFVRNRPMAYFRPPEHEDGELELVVFNTANEPIVVHGVECRPDTMRVSYRDDWRDILDPDLKGGGAIIAPNSHKRFTCVEGIGWDAQKPGSWVRIVIRWSFTSWRWLPCVPVRVSNTVERLHQIKSAVRPSA